MTTREFIQHLILNCELDDEITVEVRLPNDVKPGYFRMVPEHAFRIGDKYDGSNETLIECKGVNQ